MVHLHRVCCPFYARMYESCTRNNQPNRVTKSGMAPFRSHKSFSIDFSLSLRVKRCCWQNAKAIKRPARHGLVNLATRHDRRRPMATTTSNGTTRHCAFAEQPSGPAEFESASGSRWVRFEMSSLLVEWGRSLLKLGIQLLCFPMGMKDGINQFLLGMRQAFYFYWTS